MKWSQGRLAVWVWAAAVVLAGCSSAGTPTANVAAASAATSGASSATIVVASATPAITADAADASAIGRATALLRALGILVTADSSTMVLPADPKSWPGGTFVSGAGWEVVWDAKGVLCFVFAPGTPVTAATPLTEAEASARVAKVVAALGAGLGRPDSLSFDTGAGWSAQWMRKIDGIVAFGDGTLLMLTADGTFQSYRTSESPTMPKPALLLTRAQALATFPACRNSSKGAAKTETCTAELIWTRPATAPETDPLRLCWELKYGWTQGEEFGGVQEDLDAGTGEVVDTAAVS